MFTPAWAKELLRGQKEIMAAINDLKAGQAAIDKAVSDTAAYLKTLATRRPGNLYSPEVSGL